MKLKNKDLFTWEELSALNIGDSVFLWEKTEYGIDKYSSKVVSKEKDKIYFDCGIDFPINDNHLKDLNPSSEYDPKLVIYDNMDFHKIKIYKISVTDNTPPYF